MIYDCRKLIKWGSTFYTFYPSDVLYTGKGREPDQARLARIDPIGEMRVSVQAHRPGGEARPSRAAAIMSTSCAILIGRLFTTIPSGCSASLTALAMAAGAPR
jgi:hypothetical protein